MICQSNSHVSRLRWRSLPGIPYEPSAGAVTRPSDHNICRAHTSVLLLAGCWFLSLLLQAATIHCSLVIPLSPGLSV